MNSFAIFIRKSNYKRLHLHYNSLICLKISASSLLLLLNVYSKYLIESVYAIGIELTHHNSNANLCNVRMKQYSTTLRHSSLNIFQYYI